LNFSGAKAQDAPQTIVVSASQPPQPVRMHTGGMVQSAKLIHQVMPVYPEGAKKDNIEGTVVLRGVITKDGSVEQLQIVSGPPALMDAAMDAVKQWKYAPTRFQGEPVEVDTTISVVFTLHAPGAAAKQELIDPDLKADILKLLEVTHSVDRAQAGIRMSFEAMKPRLLTAIPETPNRDKIVADYGEKLAALFQSREFIDGITAVYAKYYSDEDVKALAQFYETPAGRNFNVHSADVQTESMKFGQQFAVRGLNEIVAEICNEYPELKGQAKFCSGSGDNKPRLTPATQ
jgi:TonB family protein